jgi:hypothetical protein
LLLVAECAGDPVVANGGFFVIFEVITGTFGFKIAVLDVESFAGLLNFIYFIIMLV